MLVPSRFSRHSFIQPFVFSFFPSPPPPHWLIDLLIEIGFHYIVLAGLELSRDPPVSTFWVVVLKVQGFFGSHSHLDYCFSTFWCVYFACCNAIFSCCTWLVLILTPTPVTCTIAAALEFFLHVCCWRKPVSISFNEEWKSGMEFSVICWKSFSFPFMLEDVFVVDTVMIDSSVTCFRTSRFYSVVFQCVAFYAL